LKYKLLVIGILGLSIISTVSAQGTPNIDKGNWNITCSSEVNEVLTQGTRVFVACEGQGISVYNKTNANLLWSKDPFTGGNENIALQQYHDNVMLSASGATGNVKIWNYDGSGANDAFFSGAENDLGISGFNVQAIAGSDLYVFAIGNTDEGIVRIADSGLTDGYGEPNYPFTGSHKNIVPRGSSSAAMSQDNYYVDIGRRGSDNAPSSPTYSGSPVDMSNSGGNVLAGRTDQVVYLDGGMNEISKKTSFPNGLPSDYSIASSGDAYWISYDGDEQISKFNVSSQSLIYSASINNNGFLDYAGGDLYFQQGSNLYRAIEPDSPDVGVISVSPASPKIGEFVDIFVDTSSEDGLSSVSADVYESGISYQSGITLDDPDDDGTYNASDAFEISGLENYTVEITSTDVNGYSTLSNYTFSVTNQDPMIENLTFNPASPEINDSVDFTADVSDDYDISSVAATVREDGNVIVTNQSLTNTIGNSYTEPDLFTADEYSTYEVIVYAQDEYGAQASAQDSRTIEVQVPTVDNVNVDPPVADSNRLDSWDISADGTVGDYPVDYIEVFFYTVEGSSQTKTVNVTTVSNGDSKGNTWSINETDLIEVLQSYEGKTVAFETTAFDSQGNSGNTNQITADVGVYSPATITSFNVTPQINQATTEDFFSLDVEGDIGEVAVDNITYSLDVSNQANPSPVTRSPDFQDQNIYRDSVSDLFEFIEEFEGEELTLTVEVTDENGITTSSQISGNSATPPNGFLQPQPNDGATFLIPEGDSNTTVDIEYGVDSSSNSGTAELFVNGNSEDSFSIPANTQDTKTVSLELTENTYNWFVRWTDGNTSETYDSASKTFEVTDEPIGLTLQEPSGGISITNDTTTSLDHVFNLDARAYSGNYYYSFRLTNSDNSNIIADRTSSTKTGGSQNTFTETVSALGEANYTWRVNVRRSSDDVLLESKNETYTITEDPIFSQRILSPQDGDLLGLDTEEPNRDVNVSYEIDTEGTEVNAELLLNGTEVDTATVGAQDYSVERTTLTDLQEGVWNLTLVGTDGSNREVVSTNIFEIVRTEDEQIEFTEIRTSPRLSEANVGDEIDVYFEGSGNVSDVDYVELEITADGETVDTIIVPSEDLQDGSWFATVENAFTVTQPLLGTTVRIAGSALANEGYTVSYVYSEILGTDRQILATLDRPADGEVFNQTAGDVEPIRFDFDVTTLTDDVNYELQIEYNGSGTFNTVANGTITDNNDTVDITRFVNHSEEFIGTQFGDWVYRVKLEETGGITNQKYTSPSREYFIVENLDVVLNLKKPEKNGIYYLDANSDRSTVPFNYDIDTGEAGTITVDINGDQVYEREVNSGYSSEQFTRKLSVGTYDANITFDSPNNFESKVSTFSVEQQPEDDEDPFVRLKEPSDGRTLYQGFGNRFSWKVFNPTTDNESDSEEGTTTLYIENEAGEVVETFVREYNTQGEVNVFSELYDTDLNIGTYKFYADFDSDSLDNTITSNERRFTVSDFRPPESTLELQKR